MILLIRISHIMREIEHIAKFQIRKAGMSRDGGNKRVRIYVISFGTRTGSAKGMLEG